MSLSPQQCPSIHEVGSWAGRPGLWLGSVEAANNCHLLQTKGITHVLTLGHRPVTTSPDLVYRTVQVMDNPLTNIILIFDECFDFIDQAFSSGGVLVHCHLGQSRSPTVILAYLMNRFGRTLSEAWERIGLIRSCIWPNIGFKLQLQCYQKWYCANTLDYGLLDLRALLSWHFARNLIAVKDHVRGGKRISYQQIRQIRCDLEDVRAYKIEDLTPEIEELPGWMPLVLQCVH